MKLAHLVLQPRRFFDEPTDAVNWIWPLVGFYLFGFASFFQNFIVHEYRVPYWLVVFVIGWVPALTLAAGLFVLLVLLWYWPASKLLGTGPKLLASTKIVGLSLFPPGVLFSASLLILASVKGSGFAAPYQPIVGAVQAVSSIWALALIVLAAIASNKFTTKRTALFVLWLAVLVVLFGIFAYAIGGEG